MLGKDTSQKKKSARIASRGDGRSTAEWDKAETTKEWEADVHSDESVSPGKKRKFRHVKLTANKKKRLLRHPEDLGSADEEQAGASIVEDLSGDGGTGGEKAEGGQEV